MGRPKFQFALDPVHAEFYPDDQPDALSNCTSYSAPIFPFGNRLEARDAFRACVCCCVGNPGIPLKGCGPGPIRHPIRQQPLLS